MQITVSEILSMQEPLQRLLTRPMQIKQSFQLARIVKQFDKEAEIFYEEHQKLLDKYAEKKDGEIVYHKDDDGSVIGAKIKEDLVEEFSKELEECLSLSVDINSKPLNISDMEIFLTVEDVLKLESILTIDEE